MSKEQTQQQQQPRGGDGSPAQTTPPPSSLPNINAETYPFEMVQHLLDQAAYFNLYSIPVAGEGAALRTGDGGSCTGFRIREALHRFEVTMQEPTRAAGLRAANAVGAQLGHFNHRWVICPDDFQARQGLEPPPTRLDPRSRQRFVMLDSVCHFGDGRDGFRGFGTGLTFPAVEGGQGRLLAAAVGNVVEGFGRFSGLEGTYTYCGSLTESEGFRGSLMLRLMDSQGVLGTDGGLPALESRQPPEPGITYLILRGQKKDRRSKTTYSFGLDGQVNGLNVSQQLRLVDIDAAVQGRAGLRSVKSVGPVIGKMNANIAFNLLNPGAPGTAQAPIPFQSFNEYTLYDRDGETVGSFVGDGGEGRTFNMELAGAPGQRALRFGGFGPLMNGTGAFSGIGGLMSDNSVVGLAPHAIVTFYVLRVDDPEGKYRAGDGGAQR
ncbi:MAG TPA: hypothetical protein VF703_00680 [Pyrinomonadaceae bacterium]|jgi:hypothetical protein